MIWELFVYLALCIFAFCSRCKQIPARLILWCCGGGVYWSVRDGRLKMSTCPRPDELCLYEFFVGGELRHHFVRGRRSFDLGEANDCRNILQDTILVLNVATRDGTHQKGSTVLNAGAGGLGDGTKATCFEIASLVNAFLGLRQGTILPYVSVMFDDFSTREFTGDDAVVII